MESVKKLSSSQCILLATHFAADGTLDSLQALTSTRSGVFDLELVLRILLSCLPEALEPSVYTSYLKSLDTPDEHLQDVTQVDVSSVDGLSETKATKRLRKLHLLRLDHPVVPIEASQDPLTNFLIHRAYRIDQETGLFHLIPQLLEPFLEHSACIRDFYVGTVLPLTRFKAQQDTQEKGSFTLQEFEDLEGTEGITTLLSTAPFDISHLEERNSGISHSFRSIVAPWVYGRQQWTPARNRRKRRRLADAIPSTTGGDPQAQQQEDGRNIEWQRTNEWILSKAENHLPSAVRAVEGWGGPQDVDFGEHDEVRQYYECAEEERVRLQKGYCQAAFAAIYAAEADDPETIDCAHSMLVRLAELLEFEPPPELATSIHMLPRVDHHAQPLDRTPMDFIRFEGLLRADNPLTMPELETFSLLQMFVYSAYLLAGLGSSLSVVKVAKLKFYSDEPEQLRLLQRILEELVTGTRQDQQQWMYARETILWLWNWALPTQPEMPMNRDGIFGSIKRDTLEKEILKALCMAGQFDLVAASYLFADPCPLSKEVSEQVVVDLTLHYYDEASNGNRTRGAMKKASDLVAAFRTQFAGSALLERCGHLIAATHALSFYSLMLQRGVSFKPAGIRLSEDPVSLLQNVLEQNPGSYTQLDKLTEISKDLVKAHISEAGLAAGQPTEDQDEARPIYTAERRVTKMAIEAALAEDDFETAYSYVVNRLSNVGSTPGNENSKTIDDVSWRAAYLAGRQRPASSNPSASGTSTSPQIRRLEQRMELLSQSLLLAPSTALPEVLAAWRRCEEELVTVLASENEAEDDFDDRADRGESNLPGAFGGVDQTFMVQPKRKELGRGAVEEAPMGLFDVARGAAAAFGRSANRSGPKGGARPHEENIESSAEEPGRQRKRDMLSNAVTGGMVSGLGWVLGAKPSEQGG